MTKAKWACLTCGGGLMMNHAESDLCRYCRVGDQTMAVPLYCGDCCLRENKCANCGSPVQTSRKSEKA